MIPSFPPLGPSKVCLSTEALATQINMAALAKVLGCQAQGQAPRVPALKSPADRQKGHTPTEKGLYHVSASHASSFPLSR